MRKAEIKRQSLESDVRVLIDLDGNGKAKVKTGIGFFDHMLSLLAFHAKLDLEVEARGDLFVDDHHTVEDIGIVFGQALKEALGDRKGIVRYGSFLLPMDEVLARAVLDISGRSNLVYRVKFTNERIGELATEMIKEFFQAVVNQAGLTLHLEVFYGENNHHIAEAIFKAFGRALQQAFRQEGTDIPSSKGLLD
jgi:imidazoleglycerol-phosphate dehydratase